MPLLSKKHAWILVTTSSCTLHGEELQQVNSTKYLAMELTRKLPLGITYIPTVPETIHCLHLFQLRLRRWWSPLVQTTCSNGLARPQVCPPSGILISKTSPMMHGKADPPWLLFYHQCHSHSPLAKPWHPPTDALLPRPFSCKIKWGQVRTKPKKRCLNTKDSHTPISARLQPDFLGYMYFFFTWVYICKHSH